MNTRHSVQPKRQFKKFVRQSMIKKPIVRVEQKEKNSVTFERPALQLPKVVENVVVPEETVIETINVEENTAIEEQEPVEEAENVETPKKKSSRKKKETNTTETENNE